MVGTQIQACNVYYIPETQKTLVLIGDKPCFGGFNYQNRGRSQVPGIYIYIYTNFHGNPQPSFFFGAIQAAFFMVWGPKGYIYIYDTYMWSNHATSKCHPFLEALRRPFFRGTVAIYSPFMRPYFLGQVVLLEGYP